MIRCLLPGGTKPLTDPELEDLYFPRKTAGPWVSFNFVSSLDGAATVNGRSGGLGSEADRRIMKLLRRAADVILVGAGTVRAEGYSGELIDEADRKWRLDQGLTERPALAIVSGSLDVDPSLPFFTGAMVRPLVITTGLADPGRRDRMQDVADVITCGQAGLDVDFLVRELRERGYPGIHSEGGPHLFGTFQGAGRVDELHLSLSPLLVGGQATRIAAAPAANPTPLGMHLEQVLQAGDMLFLRYRAQQTGAQRGDTPTDSAGIPPSSEEGA